MCKVIVYVPLSATKLVWALKWGEVVGLNVNKTKELEVIVKDLGPQKVNPSLFPLAKLIKSVGIKASYKAGETSLTYVVMSGIIQVLNVVVTHLSMIFKITFVVDTILG